MQVYDGRLLSDPAVVRRSLRLLPEEETGAVAEGADRRQGAGGAFGAAAAPPARLLSRATGVCAVPVAHRHFNAQSSGEECAAVEALVAELTDPTRTLLDLGGGAAARGLTLDDIVVVSPFNLQVRHSS